MSKLKKTEMKAWKVVSLPGRICKGEEVIIDPYTIEMILGKTKIEGSKLDWEKIMTKRDARDFGEYYIVRRKDLLKKTDAIIRFVQSYCNGSRSLQWHPYTRDLFDDNLLEDAGIIVLNYKHFYSGDGEIDDVYYAVSKDFYENNSVGLLMKLERISETAMREYYAWEERRKQWTF